MVLSWSWYKEAATGHYYIISKNKTQSPEELFLFHIYLTSWQSINVADQCRTFLNYFVCESRCVKCHVGWRLKERFWGQSVSCKLIKVCIASGLNCLSLWDPCVEALGSHSQVGGLHWDHWETDNRCWTNRPRLGMSGEPWVRGMLCSMVALPRFITAVKEKIESEGFHLTAYCSVCVSNTTLDLQL